MEPSVKQVYYSEQLTTNEQNPRQKYLTGSIDYVATGYSNEDAVIKATRDTAPRVYKGMNITSIQILERGNDNTWKVQAHYNFHPIGTVEDDGTAVYFREPQVTFDYNSKTEIMLYSRETLDYATHKYPEGIDAPVPNKDYFQNGINVDPMNDGKPKGVEIYKPETTFQETLHFKESDLTNKYKRTLDEMVGTVNDAPWRGYERGEVLFLGVTGSNYQHGNPKTYALTFRFAVRRNEKNVDVGEFEVVEKNGWDYLWIFETEAPVYGLSTKGGEDGEDPDAESEWGVTGLIQRPEAIFLERVYEYTDFSKLNLGGR